ncbi:MAG: peptidoglycan bridge formation glycyltransferase FemA/FemB family protein [Cyclobacteriaceae bacterium]|nr:peptidoglycan bridge formation glycyltransferase FemA/FemB family protein [Cyclobacteriaceae bacterium]
MHCSVEPKEIEAIQESNIAQQTAFWARVKHHQGMKPFAFKYKAPNDLLYPDTSRSKLFQDDLLVLLQAIDDKHSVAYVPYGPEIEPDAENHGVFLEELSEVLRSHLPKNCILIRFDLPWENQWSKEEDYYDENGHWMGPPTVRNQEYRLNFKTNEWNLVKCQSNILPTNTIFLDLNHSSEKLLGKMKPKTRYNVKLSQRKGVRVQSYGLDKIDIWLELYQQTASRNGINYGLQDAEYFRSVLATPTDDLPSQVEVQLLMADRDGEYLAAMFLMLSAKRGTYLYGASSDNQRNLMATYAVQWEAMRRAQAYGCLEYDMFGAAPNGNPGHPMHGLYRFKTGFGGKMFHSMGCWDYPLDHEQYAIFAAVETNGPKYHVN